jgi:hypothetical protein
VRINASSLKMALKHCQSELHGLNATDEERLSVDYGHRIWESSDFTEPFSFGHESDEGMVLGRPDFDGG